MANELLQVENLYASVEANQILHGIDLKINPGETHVLMGPNGAGKSTLGYAVMGSPNYQIDKGDIFFEGESIVHETPDKRAKRGIFLSFQTPLEVPGITLSSFLRTAVQQRTGQRIRIFAFKRELEKALALLDMDPAYADRDLNVGFSGGEKKKAEILQMLLLRPKLAILDETDSGLDVDAVRTVSKGILAYQKAGNGSLLIITHSARILESLQVDCTHVMAGGKLIRTGGAELIDAINENGFDYFLEQAE